MAWRCAACGNKTRFDVFVTKKVRAFHHFTLGGHVSIEEEEILDSTIERVVCRWCGAADSVEARREADESSAPAAET